MSRADPHADQPIETAGESLEDASAAVVIAHGRGATAPSILGLAEDIDVADVAYVAPQASHNTWYPHSFMAPMSDNEPWLSSALAFFARAVVKARDAGLADEQIILGGFSQGACLASEFTARNAWQWGGVFALSGGLIGPEGTEFDFEGSLEGTPVFIGCSDVDPHIPLERVHETAEVFEDLDADVDERIYEGIGHGIIPEEIEAVRELVEGVVEQSLD